MEEGDEFEPNELEGGLLFSVDEDGGIDPEEKDDC
jgi:hypothetical protein